MAAEELLAGSVRLRPITSANELLARTDIDAFFKDFWATRPETAVLQERLGPAQTLRVWGVANHPDVLVGLVRTGDATLVAHNAGNYASTLVLAIPTLAEILFTTTEEDALYVHVPLADQGLWHEALVESGFDLLENYSGEDPNMTQSYVLLRSTFELYRTGDAP